jgi:ESCRT-II complex subunit VPS25
MATPPPPTKTPTPTPPSPSTTFPFPPEYSFPPFFTRQTNLTTHHAQLIKWSTLVLAFCRHHRLFKLSLSGTGTTTSPTNNDNNQKPEIDTTTLFHNPQINRRLSLPDIREVIDFLRKQGRAEYLTPASSSSSSSGGGGATYTSDEGGGGGGDVVWIYWRTPEEWASLVEGWVDATGQKGSVLTVYELVEGDGSRGAGEFSFVFVFLLSLVLVGIRVRGTGVAYQIDSVPKE